MGIMENNAFASCFYCMPAGMGRLHIPNGSQIQQSTDHKIYVILNIPHIPNDSSVYSWYHTNLSSPTVEFGPILVRNWAARLVEWSTFVRANESFR